MFSGGHVQGFVGLVGKERELVHTAGKRCAVQQFRRCKGMTFSQFVMQYRLNTVCSLLEHSRKSVSEICWLVGFNDVPHFVRVFTREKGVSPGRYRKRQA